MGFFGEVLLAAIFLLCGFVAFFGLTALNLGEPVAKVVLRRLKELVVIASGLFILVLVMLAGLFATNDFSIAAVAQHSSSKLAIVYKLSALWAGSAGSWILWSAGVFLCFVLSLLKIDKKAWKFSGASLVLGAFICLGFTSILVFVEKPFAGCPVTVDEGAGLNPLLRNFWMIVHPPLLFAGYSAFLIPFIVALAAVFTGSTDSPDIYRLLRRWLLVGICFLGLGIFTGSRWSYMELGWGGYWAWDPVENASLLPWLVAVAALHSIIGMRIAERFKRWALILAPLPFVLCLLGTFITRSGIIQSVHSFDQNVLFTALLVFMGLCTAIWLVGVIEVLKKIVFVPVPSEEVSLRLEKGDLLFWANVIFLITAAVIAAATLLPVIWRIVSGSDSGPVLQRSFYDRVISISGIMLAFLIGLAALSDLQKRRGFGLCVCTSLGTGLICFGLVSNLVATGLLMGLACGIFTFSAAAILIRLAVGLRRRYRLGSSIAHTGFLILVVGAGFSSVEKSVQPLLSKGQQVSLGNYKLVYDSFEHRIHDGITQVGPEIILHTDSLLAPLYRQQPKSKSARLWPHSNLYPDGRSSTEVAVHTGVFEDIYVSFEGTSDDARVLIAAKLIPFMLWLWIGAILVLVGSAWAFFEAEKSKKAGPS